MERRSQPTKFESSGNTLIGYASVFNSSYPITEAGRSFHEVVRPGAFRSALASQADVIATLNHNPDRLLGRLSSGTLRLSEDQHGLRFELDLPESAADIKELVARQDLNGASFSFSVPKGGDVWTGNNRELVNLHLYELGPVAMPASPHTSLGLRTSQILLRCAEYDLRKRI